MKLLDRINRTGTTVVMATHDAGIVDQMRKRVIELSNGTRRPRPVARRLRLPALSDDGSSDTHAADLRLLRARQRAEAQRVHDRSPSIVTIFVSLTLVGMGLLLNAQAHKAEDYWGSKLQITVFLCNQNSAAANCVNGEVTDAQKAADPEGARAPTPRSRRCGCETKQEAYDKWKAAYVSDNDTERRVYQSIKPSDMQESYWVQLKDPEKFQGIKSAVQGLQGVNTVRDLRSVLKPIYFWMNVMQWGAIADRGVPDGRGGPAGRQHDPAGGVRAAAGDRHHAAGGRLQPLHPAAVPDGVAGRRADRGRPGRGRARAVHVRGDLPARCDPPRTSSRGSTGATRSRPSRSSRSIGLALTLLPTLVMTRKYLKV